MEGRDGGQSSAPQARYTLQPSRYSSEDILFCIDVDPESLAEMKGTAPSGRPITRLDSIKQAILLFINAKLTINPDHRFAFATLAKSASWLRKEFSSEVDSAMLHFGGCQLIHPLVKQISPNSSELLLMKQRNPVCKIGFSGCRFWYSEKVNSYCLWVKDKSAICKRHSSWLSVVYILIYCRSSTQPHHQWPVNQKIFTLDVLYLHDKPGPDNVPRRFMIHLLMPWSMSRSSRVTSLKVARVCLVFCSVICVYFCRTLNNAVCKITSIFPSPSRKSLPLLNQHRVKKLLLYPASEKIGSMQVSCALVQGS
ncbi:hypothetical protein C3L33_21754, partial [Rhododendron williamsianum]